MSKYSKQELEDAWPDSHDEGARESLREPSAKAREWVRQYIKQQEEKEHADVRAGQLPPRRR